MTIQQQRDKHTESGKGWCEHGLVSVDPYEHFGRTIIGVNIGEERFDTDSYSRKDFALCEAKGWLEGVKAQIEGVLDAINKEIEDFKEEKVMKESLMLQSNCTDCKLYEGFGQCYEHGNNLIENCKDYQKE